MPPAPRTQVKIEFAQASDPGRDPAKQVNEDSCGYVETALGHLCVLCDGMGGHHGGQEASRLAISTIFQLFNQELPTANPAMSLKRALEEAGRRVYRLGGPPDNRTRPGSTVVAMVLHDRGVDVAHVGDSRAYVIRANQIYPLTRDHSMVQGMIDAGMITEAEAIGHPDANKITRALGMRPEADVDVRPEPMDLFPGDILLLASDGLTDLAVPADILGAVRQALASGPIATACNQLVQMANDRGGHDNITVQMARVVELGARPPAAMLGPLQNSTAPPGPPQPTQLATPHAGSVGMTMPMTVPGGSSETASAHADPARGGAAAWAPVMPTATDLSPTAPNVDVRSNPPPGGDAAWNSGMYFGPDSSDMAPPSGRDRDRAQAPVRGGIVFLIFGASAIVAILTVLAIWALFLR